MTINLTTRGYLLRNRDTNEISKKETEMKSLRINTIHNHTWTNMNKTNPNRVEELTHQNTKNGLNLSKFGNKKEFMKKS